MGKWIYIGYINISPVKQHEYDAIISLVMEYQEEFQEVLSEGEYDIVFYYQD